LRIQTATLRLAHTGCQDAGCRKPAIRHSRARLKGCRNGNLPVGDFPEAARSRPCARASSIAVAPSPRPPPSLSDSRPRAGGPADRQAVFFNQCGRKFSRANAPARDIWSNRCALRAGSSSAAIQILLVLPPPAGVSVNRRHASGRIRIKPGRRRFGSMSQPMLDHGQSASCSTGHKWARTD